VQIVTNQEVGNRDTFAERETSAAQIAEMITLGVCSWPKTRSWLHVAETQISKLESMALQVQDEEKTDT